MATEFNTQVGNGEYRLQFETDNKEHYLLMQSAARRCIDRAHMTNADRVRAMNAEQLAEWALFSAPQIGREYSHSLIGLIIWLQQPTEEDDNGKTD